MSTVRPMSRRTFLPLAAAALSPSLLVPQPARAQDANWQMYRREDFGFEIEMPGRPEILESDIDGWRAIDAVLDFDQMHFGVSHQESEQSISIQRFSAAQRMAARHLGIKALRETAITMNGFPGLDFVGESDGFSLVLRIVIMNKRMISAVVSSHGRKGAPLSENPSVRRFLDSFKLLP